MKPISPLMALRTAKRKMLIHQMVNPRDRGPLGSALSFKTDADLLDEPLEELEFQNRVLSGHSKASKAIEGLTKAQEAQGKTVKSLEDKQEEILKAMPKDIKATLEDIEKLKTKANDQQANYEKMLKLITDFDEKIRNHARFGFENPIDRVKANAELRDRFNLAVRLVLSKDSEYISSKMADRAKELTGCDLRELKARQTQRHEAIVAGKALGEDTSPGSTLIDDRLASEIYDTLSTFGIWNTFQVDQVSNQTVKYPVATARPTANFILTEAGTVSDASFTGTSVSCVIEVIAALINVSLQLLQDAEYDLTGFVMKHFAEAFSNRLDVACLTATGAADATNGGMTGVFVGGTAANAASGNSATELLDFEDFTRALLTVDPIVLNRMAKWWTHPQHLIRSLSVKDGNGRPIFLTALEAPAARSIGTILGYPVVPCFAAPTANVATTKTFVFGDPGGQVVGMRSQYTFEASDHFRWNTLERSFRGWGRAGTKIRAATAFAMLTLTA